MNKIVYTSLLLYVFFVLQSVCSTCNVFFVVPSGAQDNTATKVYYFDYDAVSESALTSSFIVDDDDDDKRRFVLLDHKRYDWPREANCCFNVCESDCIDFTPIILFFSDASPPLHV